MMINWNCDYKLELVPMFASESTQNQRWQVKCRKHDKIHNSDYWGMPHYLATAKMRQLNKLSRPCA